MMEPNIIILVIFVFDIASCRIIVETNSGPVQSTESLSDDVEVFLGIPFAEPPVGDLRFAKPVPKRPWTETYQASSLPAPCAQIPQIPEYYFTGNISDMSEDCLYLNIWMPKTKGKENLRPIIIYIHHGAFIFGSSNQKEFDGSRIASRADAIVVTINYRLGVLGFFLAYTEEADGNMAMYDQLMAIEWVSNNAKHFGGDPENIVLMGTSAGAISIGAHILSPLSQGFIKRVILQSGSIINPIHFNGNERMFKISALAASIAGCTNENVSLETDPSSVVDCLKRRPLEVLLETEGIIVKSQITPFYLRVGDAFLPEETLSTLREGKFRSDIDAMFGTTVDEGSLFMFMALHDYTGQYGKITPPISRTTGILMGRTAATVSGTKNTSELESFYLKRYKSQPGFGYVKLVADSMGDFGAICGNIFQADFFSLNGNPVYYYKFAFRSPSSPMVKWVQATHLDDVPYFFGNPYHGNFSAEEVELSNRLIARLSAFVKTGNPNVPGEVPWKRYSYQNPLYLNIGQEGESLRLKPSSRCDPWRKRFQSEIDSNLVRALSETAPSHSNKGLISSHGNSLLISVAFLYLTASYGLDFLRQFPSLTKRIGLD